MSREEPLCCSLLCCEPGEVEGLDDGGSGAEVLVAVLLDQGSRELIEAASDESVDHLRDRGYLVDVCAHPACIASASVGLHGERGDVALADEACEHEGTSCDDGGSVADEVAVVEGELHEEARNTLRPGILFAAKHAHPCLRGRVTQLPAQCLEDVALHLEEGRLVVGLAAH